MGQKEMKVLKFPSNHQRYYFSFMESFGWEVQEFHEMVDGAITYSSGSTSSYNFGSFHGNTQHFRGSNMSHLSGHTWDFGESYDSGTEITEVTTSFTVTFVRDRDFPHKAELDQIEQRFHNLTPAYFKRLNKIHIFFKDIPEDQWPEWQAVLACSNDAWEVRRRPVQQSPTRQVSAPKPKPTPKQPVKKAPPAPVVKLKSPEEYVKDFCKAQNWDKNKKGKDEFLKGLLCYFTDFKDINALKYFQKAVEINPKEPIYWQWLADPVYYQKDYQYNYQKSIEIYHQALKELPNNQYILENLIYTYIRAEEINNAEEYLKILKKVTPDDDIKYQISALRLKGGIQEAKGEFKEAMQLYNEADKLFGSEKNILVGIYQRNLKDKMKKSK